MLIEFRCRCGHEFRTKPENAGRSITCPNCLAPSAVPDASATCVELPAYEERRSLAPPVPAVRPAKEVDRATRTDHEDGNHPRDLATTKRRSPDVEPTEARSNRPGRSASRSKHRADLERDEDEAPSPVDEFEQIDEWTSPRRRKRKAADEDGRNVGLRKSKKPKREARSNVPLIVGGTVATLLLLGCTAFFAVPALIAAAKDSGKIKTPQEFEKYENNDFNFRCEVPKGWDVEGRGGSGNIPPSVRIEQGRVKIVYRSSQSGAAIQDMSQAQANMAGGELSEELQPVSRVHDFQRDKFTEEMANYKELGQVEKIDTGWGEGRLSTFTASTGLNGTIYGYRVTLLTAQYQWVVVCQCTTKREFLAYQPIFRRMLSSTGR